MGDLRMVDARKRSTFMVEYGRGTETVEQFSRKINFYERGLDGFPFDAVLILTETQGRLDVLARTLRKKRFLAAPLSQVRQTGIFSEVFGDITGCNQERRTVSIRDSGNLPDRALYE